MTMLWIGIVLPALAGSPEPASDVAALWENYLFHFEPEALGADAANRPEFTCATPLLPQLEDHWLDFTDEQRARMTRALAPWKRDWLDPVADRPPRPPSEHAETSCFTTSRPSGAGSDWEYPVEETLGACHADGVATTTECASHAECDDGSGATWTCEGYDPGSPGNLPNRIVTEHFSVEWDEADVSEATAQAWADALEESWEVEIDDMGWKAPIKSDEYRVLAYISSMGFQGAFTYADECEGEYMPYIVAGEGSFVGNSTWFQDMAAHELNHAIQYAYGMAHEPWFWEATATWIQEYVFPSHDWWAFYVEGFASKPHLALNASSQQDYDIFMHMYGMSIFNFYLDEYVGGPELVQDLWVAGQSALGQLYSYWIGDALEAVDQDLDDIYDGFIAANTVMEYTSGVSYPDVEQVQSVGSLPATGGNDGEDRPQGYGQNYVRIATSTAHPATPDLRLEFAGDVDRSWTVLLVGIEDDAVARVQKVAVTDGEGTGTLKQYGDYDDVFMVVSPLEASERGRSYDWEILAIDTDTWEDPGDPDETRGLGCACSTGAGRGPGFWWLLPLGLAWRRRR